MRRAVRRWFGSVRRWGYLLAWFFLAVAVVSLWIGFDRDGVLLLYVSIGASALASVATLVGVPWRGSRRLSEPGGDGAG